MKGPNEGTHELLGHIVQAPSKNWYDQSLDHAVNRIEDFLLSSALSAAVLFAAISVIFYTITATTRLSKIILFGRQTVMMQPSSALACFTLVAYFAGQVDAYFNVPKGVCLKRAMGGSPTSCTADDIKITSVAKNVGPTVCPEGQYVNVTINTTISVTAGTRDDIGIYVGLGGEDAKLSLGNQTCLVQSLSNDVVYIGDGSIGYKESSNDKCLDSDKGIIKGFVIDDFTVFCNYTEYSTNVSVSVCLVWDQGGPAADCNKTCPTETGQDKCLLPGTGSVSDCHVSHLLKTQKMY
jgi:hypothetical protein